MFYGLDPFFPLILATLAASFWASWRVKSTFKKFEKIPVSTGESGREIAARLMRENSLPVRVFETPGTLTDHFDPTKNELRLSPAVGEGRSIAAVAVAAHEAGHALQKAANFWALGARGPLLGMAKFGSGAAPWIFIAGLIFSAPILLKVGIVFFAVATVFTVLTLPIEFDASRRALVWLERSGLAPAELAGARKVLSAAALTYLMAALMAALELARMIWLARQRG